MTTWAFLFFAILWDSDISALGLGKAGRPSLAREKYVPQVTLQNFAQWAWWEFLILMFCLYPYKFLQQYTSPRLEAGYDSSISMSFRVVRIVGFSNDVFIPCPPVNFPLESLDHRCLVFKPPCSSNFFYPMSVLTLLPACAFP